MEPTKVSEPPRELVHINITYDPLTDQIQMMAPFEMKVLCYGILEKAKLIVRDFKEAKPETPLILPDGVIPMPKGPN